MNPQHNEDIARLAAQSRPEPAHHAELPMNEQLALEATARPKLRVSRETLRRMTPAAGQVGFMCSTINTDEMMNVFLATVSRADDLEVVEGPAPDVFDAIGDDGLGPFADVFKGKARS